MKQKVFHLKEMIRILELFCSEIDYGQSTLVECCEMIADKVPFPYMDIFKKISEHPKEEGIGFGQLCERYLREGLRVLPVNEEKEYFIRCFMDIGYADVRMQKRCMERGIEELRGCLCAEEEDLKMRSKLAITLGTMSGLFLVLIML